MEGLVVGYADVDAGLLDALPALRVIATSSTGLDMIDLEATRARGVQWCP
ncbi:hypothetical protein [Salmonella enterica]